MKSNLFTDKKWAKLTRRERLLLACWQANNDFSVVNMALKFARCTPVTEKEYIEHYEYLDRMASK